jgi:hypothetical protein
MITGRDVNPDPSSIESFSIAQNWIRTCHHEHSACYRPISAYPTRLIDVLSRPDPFLVETMDGRGSYMTLSHRWGTQETTATTTVMKYTANKLKIPYLKLPKTFQDAIYIARRLGAQYLWIDSFCILQDSKEDWQRECAKMCDYYRNSWLTLSALGFSNSSAGMLKTRERSSEAHIKISAEDNLYCRQPMGYCFTDQELCRGGWVFQERLLSNRILHYGSSQMFWECSTYSARESISRSYSTSSDTDKYAGPGDPTGRRGLEFDQIELKRIVSTPPLSSLTKEEIFRKWRHVIDYYSQLPLTKESDKLPAVMGLRQLFEEALVIAGISPTYLMGVWKEHVNSLLWMGGGSYQNALTSPGIARAPSWSWASTNSTVWWESFLNSRLSFAVPSASDALILDAYVAPHSDMGIQISPPWISIRGLTSKVFYRLEGRWGGKVSCDVEDANGGLLGRGYCNEHRFFYGFDPVKREQNPAVDCCPRPCAALRISERRRLGKEELVLHFLLIERREEGNTWIWVASCNTDLIGYSDNPKLVTGLFQGSNLEDIILL